MSGPRAKGIEPVSRRRRRADEAIEALDFLGGYFGELLEERRRHPKEDLLEWRSVQARESDDRLTDAEVTSHRHPALRRRIRDDDQPVG